MPDVLLPYSLTFSRIAIGLAFTASSIGKLRDFPMLERGIGNFQILPRRLARACAHLFLAGEVAVAALMLFGAGFLRIGFLLATAYLMSVESSQRPSIFQRIADQEWLGAYLIWLEQAYRQIVEEGVSPAQALAAAQEKSDNYRARVIARNAFSQQEGWQACLKEIDPTLPAFLVGAGEEEK